MSQVSDPYVVRRILFLEPLFTSLGTFFPYITLATAPITLLISPSISLCLITVSRYFYFSFKNIHRLNETLWCFASQLITVKMERDCGLGCLRQRRWQEYWSFSKKQPWKFPIVSKMCFLPIPPCTYLPITGGRMPPCHHLDGACGVKTCTDDATLDRLKE